MFIRSKLDGLIIGDYFVFNRARLVPHLWNDYQHQSLSALSSFSKSIHLPRPILKLEGVDVVEEEESVEAVLRTVGDVPHPGPEALDLGAVEETLDREGPQAGAGPMLNLFYNFVTEWQGKENSKWGVAIKKVAKK